MRNYILKMQKGEELGKEALQKIVGGYLSGKVTREEETDFLRAVCTYSLSEKDAIALTEVMLESGKTLCFKKRSLPYADKHSTGGLADSTTLLVAPIVAAAGVPFLKMSGRKLGHTGGTIDKLEKFKGLNPEMPIESAERVVDKTGAAIIAQSEELVPADKALYKLRDETGTVKSLPLIASSIVSKKLASGADVFVLDVKTGNGAFMESLKESVALARLMLNILSSHGKKAAAVISDMDEPLGNAIGGALEVSDAIEALSGKESRLSFLSLLLSSELISLAKNVRFAEAAAEAKRLLESGAAKAKLMEIISAEGGDLTLFSKEERDRLFFANAGTICADRSGYVKKIDCVSLGNLAREFESLGGYGIYFPKKIGDAVEKGDVLARFCGETPASPSFLARLSSCIVLQDGVCNPLPLFYEILKEDPPSV